VTPATLEPKLRLHPAAIDELAEAVRWYESEVLGLGEQFRSAALAVLEDIPRDPRVGRRLEVEGGDHGCRVRRLHRFPYLVVYREAPSLLVVAVAHTRRRSGYWLDRLK
jgi:hypothetical protein